MYFLGELILILLTTVLLGQLFARFNMPAVVGELLSGIVLGPALLNWVKPNDIISLFSQFGVILLMFLAGLESDLDLLKKYFKLSFTVAGIGVILPVVFMGLASYAFGMKPLEAIFIGIVFAATSVSISVVVLKEAHQLQTRAGTAILGAAVVDDILAVIVLSLFTTFSHEGGKSGITNNFFINLLIEAAYFVVVWIIYKFIAPYFMKIAEKLDVNYSVVIASLILALTMAWAADFVGLSAVVGAFFGGLAIRQTPQYKEVNSSISAIGYSVFIPVFFADIGLSMTFDSFFKDIWFILVMTVLAVVSKFWAGKYSSEMFGFSKNEANIVGSGMVSRGEVALIVAQIGITHHLFPEDIYSSLILVIIITTVLSPFILNHYIKKAN
ncbi:cation:proton antiporter [Lactobacillus acetotolerans]|uniref:Cation:proton antiporter n=3 Tax=Lactobacillus acetotolerans TaxID=1600 RepID=A0A5P5ZLI2_9LACO|nr:cation:proton antiporter [Lactobacillus acetotolerans]KRN41766.1 periplasmic nitrate reductase NapA [Lactobacillus acetotolerans DSM 20749 = JCM 3825]QFG51912.1 cation:proton antiporter [Lactobacillus acetotolerans]QJD72896.1 cation:proton antiporter [Lactobacillus acetotolerans]GGV08995.1 sodium:proton antiporter [Lactobacillus acetotolerans DSM 20749 = JCM 3825]